MPTKEYLFRAENTILFPDNAGKPSMEKSANVPWRAFGMTVCLFATNTSFPFKTA